MEQTAQTATRNAYRDRLIDGIELIESLPLLRPRWAAFDVAVIVLMFWF